MADGTWSAAASVRAEASQNQPTISRSFALDIRGTTLENAEMQTTMRPEQWRPPTPLPQRLETPRLVIKYHIEADAPALFRAVDESRATLLPWMPWAHTEHRSVESSLACIRRFMASRANSSSPENNSVFGFAVGIFDKSSGELLGGTGFNRIDFDTSDAETGYWVATHRQGTGIATEATGAMLSWGLTPQAEGGWGFRRVRIVAAAANGPSCTVPRKLGLREECRLVKHRWVDGLGWDDTVCWGVLAEEWDRNRHALRTQS